MDWVIFIVAFPVALLRLLSVSYPADYFSLILYISLFGVIASLIFCGRTGKFRKSSVVVSKIYGIILPAWLLFVTFSCFYIVPTFGSEYSVVMYLDSDPNKAQVIEECTFFNPFNYSATSYSLTKSMSLDQSISLMYYFDGDALEFHRIYLGKTDEFQSVIDSTTAVIIDLFHESYQGKFLSEKIRCLHELLDDWTWPDNVAIMDGFGITVSQVQEM